MIVASDTAALHARRLLVETTCEKPVDVTSKPRRDGGGTHLANVATSSADVKILAQEVMAPAHQRCDWSVLEEPAEGTLGFGLLPPTRAYAAGATGM